MPPLESVDERLQQAMKLVLLATLPGMLALFWFYGWGVLINLILAGIGALAAEAAVLRLRERALKPTLIDGSALVSATLLALALPPYCPWWLTVSAAASAMLFGKHLYGGVGSNPFNPAMLGFALVMVAFPQQMTHWPASHGMDLSGGIRQVFGFGENPDAWVRATALDSLRINKSLTMDELFAANPAFGRFGGHGVEWVNLAFLAGGAFLLQRRVFSCHAPVGMLASLFIVSLLCWNGSGSDSHGSPLFHLLTGASMLGAFFIVTEPVSGAKTPGARLLFGIGVGLLTYLIRTWGGYPDGVAFAVLLMNLCVPALERFVAARQEPIAP
ncbi:RnfABCDGE type electron transport complex subunit D [Pseudomonas azerbaijanoccidentalis]